MRATDPSVFPVRPEPLPGPPEEVVRILSPYVTPARLARIEAVAARRTLAVLPILDNLADPHNGAAVLRSCDAFGVHRVRVVSNERPFYTTTKISRGCDRWLDIQHEPSPEAAAEATIAEGYRIFVADMDGEHTPESLRSFPKVALVFGNERRGAGEALRARAHGSFRVPMDGFVESLNVSVAAAVTLYTVTRDRPVVTGDDHTAVLARLLFATVHDATRVVDGELRGGGA